MHTVREISSGTVPSRSSKHSRPSGDRVSMPNNRKRPPARPRRFLVEVSFFASVIGDYPWTCTTHLEVVCPIPTGKSRWGEILIPEDNLLDDVVPIS